MNILLVDDDFLIQQSVKMRLKDGFNVISAGSYLEATNLLESKAFELCITDINLGKNSESGIELLKYIKSKLPELPVIMMSGNNETAVIVQCMQLGADDFIEKPFDGQHLPVRIKKVFSDSKKNRILKRSFEIVKSTHQIVGENPALQKAKNLVEQAGKMRILFYGETGVGKTPFAWYSNQIVSQEDNSPRPFEHVNCSGLNSEHFQDQLFGHKKGAFTGAVADKKGFVELAAGGDLFLDEIGEMPLETQAMFLTFLDSGEYYRLGDDIKRKADVRILCGTNRDLKKMVADGTFRKDLYSRISQVVVEIPPLRQRTSDIQPLLEHFIRTFSGFDKPYNQQILEVFLKYPWQEGNIRELRDNVEYLCIMGRNDSELNVSHLNENIKPVSFTSELQESREVSESWLSLVPTHGLETCLNLAEKKILEHYYLLNKRNVDELAKVLKTTKPTLYRRLRQYSIE
jgi:DNA-binding NtrC family response regulator